MTRTLRNVVSNPNPLILHFRQFPKFPLFLDVGPNVFASNDNNWGIPGMLEWSDLIGPDFLQEGYVHIEVLFKVDPPIGLDFTGEKLMGAGKAHMSSDLLAFYESGEGTDVVLRSRDGREFSCHQFILCARSPVFRVMFQNEMKEKAEGLVAVDMEGRSLNLFCKYLYSGELSGVEADADKEKQGDLEIWKELVKAGDMYELHHLSKLAAHALVLRRTPGNAWEIMSFLKMFGEEKLAESMKAMKQFFMHNVKDIMGE